jgi:cytochrome c biogenesis protein CcmG, thiol:disulfide interchange protein DsbE
VLAALVIVLRPARPPDPGTAVFVLSSGAGEKLSPTKVAVGSQRLTVAGEVPRAPEVRTVARLSLDPGAYSLQVGGLSLPEGVSIRSNQVVPVLLAVSGGRIDAGGVYSGAQSLNLGLSELAGQLTRLGDFHLTDHTGAAVTSGSFLGRDTVIAAFHTTCRETCPLYTGLLFQLRKSAPAVRLVEVTTDPVADTPAALAEYRARIGADWTFATGTPDEVTEFWAPFGVSLATGDSHTSALALVDSHGFVRAGFTGVPDVGGRLPGALETQLDPAGRQLLAGHGEGWGAPSVLESLRTISVAGSSQTSGGQAPSFSLRTLDGRAVSLDEYRGRPVVVNFWYAGCPPCQQEMPLLQRAADQHPRVSVLLVNYRDSAGTASSFAAARGVRATVLLDQDGRASAAYRVAGFPTTVFVRTDGSEQGRHPGPLTESVLAANISNLGAR